MNFQNSEWKSMFGSNESDSSNASLSPKARTLQKTAESLEKKLNTSQTVSQTSSSSGSFVTMSQSQVSSEGSIRSVTEKGSDKNPISESAFVVTFSITVHAYLYVVTWVGTLCCWIVWIPLCHNPFSVWITGSYFLTAHKTLAQRNILAVAFRQQNLYWIWLLSF